jgi:hypothetical protein
MREATMARIRNDVKGLEDKKSEWAHAFDPEPVVKTAEEEVSREEFKWQHRYGNKNPQGQIGWVLRESKAK